MRIHSWYVTLGIVGASSVAMVACTSTTTVNGTGDDASTTDSSTAANDTGTTTPEPDGTTPVTEAGGACPVALDTGSPDCDSCTAACCTQLTTCATPDDAGVDDAGSSACLQLLACINDVNSSSDAGVDAGVGESTCEMGGIYTADEQTNANAVLSCIRTSCAAQCPGL